MSVLPAGQPLGRFLPDLEDLLRDPRAYLQAGPVVVGPRRMYGLAALFALPGLALLASCALGDKDLGERLALGIALLVGASLWLGWSVMLRGHSLVLSAEGVEVRYRDTAVWCPWALFNVEGEPFVPEGDSPRQGLTLPVAPGAVPFLELRRTDSAVSHGAQVQSRQLQFTGRDEVVLPARYEVAAADLGRLLLLLGRRLGHELPRGAPPREAYALEALEQVPAGTDADGWITVYLTRIVLPAVCCDCGQATQETMPLRVQSHGSLITDLLVQQVRPLEVAVPVCPACRQRLRQRQERGGGRGLALGLILGLAGGAMLSAAQAGLLLPLALGGAAVGGIAGFIIGTLAARQPPVQLARYSPSRGTVALRFRNPGYAALVLEAMRGQARDPPGDWT
jgi:hypothetical protein